MWAKDCVLTEHHNNLTGVNLIKTSTKICVPAVTLSINDNIKFLELLKQGIKKIVSWNKYRSQKTIQPKNNNLDQMIVPTFKNISRRKNKQEAYEKLVEMSWNNDYTTEMY